MALSQHTELRLKVLLNDPEAYENLVNTINGGGPPPSGPAGGDLSGNYPNPAVAFVGGATAVAVAAVAALAPLIPTAGEKAALPGTSGAPGAGNPYVTDADPRNTNARTPTGAAGGDLAGAYPTPSVATVGGVAAASIAANLPTVGEKAALPGTSGAPGAGNPYVTDADPRNTNARTPTGAAGGDLAGAYPTPSVATVGGVAAASIAANLPTVEEKAALVGTSGAPGAGNPYVTAADDRVSGTRSVFFLAETNASMGDYRVRNIGSTGNFRFDFAVPEDFGALVSVHAIGAPSAGAAGAARNIDLSSDYGANGQSTTTHSETDTTTTYDLTGTSGQWYALNLSTVFTALAAGDRCGVVIDHQTIGGGIDYLGVELRYTP